MEYFSSINLTVRLIWQYQSINPQNRVPAGGILLIGAWMYQPLPPAATAVTGGCPTGFVPSADFTGENRFLKQKIWHKTGGVKNG
jgi:hypothetical protein